MIWRILYWPIIWMVLISTGKTMAQWRQGQAKNGLSSSKLLFAPVFPTTLSFTLPRLLTSSNNTIKMVPTLQSTRKSVNLLTFMPFNFITKATLVMTRMMGFSRRLEVGSVAPVSKRLLIVGFLWERLLWENLQPRLTLWTRAMLMDKV